MTCIIASRHNLWLYFHHNPCCCDQILLRYFHVEYRFLHIYIYSNLSKCSNCCWTVDLNDICFTVKTAIVNSCLCQSATMKNIPAKVVYRYVRQRCSFISPCRVFNKACASCADFWWVCHVYSQDGCGVCVCESCQSPFIVIARKRGTRILFRICRFGVNCDNFIYFSDPTHEHVAEPHIYFMGWLFCWIVPNHYYQTWWQLFEKSNWIAIWVYMLDSVYHAFIVWNSNVGTWLASGGEYITVYSLQLHVCRKEWMCHSLQR